MINKSLTNGRIDRSEIRRIFARHQKLNSR